MKRLVILLAAIAAALVVTGGAAMAETSGTTSTKTSDAEASLENSLREGGPQGTGVTGQTVSAASSGAQPDWQYGPVSRSYYYDWFTGMILTYTMDFVAYWGAEDVSYPRVGDLYYGRVVVGNVTSNIEAYPIIDVILPPNTNFDIDLADPSRKIRCYLWDYENDPDGVNLQELTGTSCPTQPSQGIHGWNLSPESPWRVDPGKALLVDFPIHSTATLEGIAGPDCLIGAVMVGAFDDVPESGDTCPLEDNDGAYQGVFVAPEPDTTPPNTTITSGPSGVTRSTSASFRFSSSEAGSRFQCSLDGSAFASCSSPKGYADLKNGRHTFRVRAIDQAGNVDASPASRTWTVDTIKPTISGMSPKHESVIADTTPTVKATVKDNFTNLSKANIKLYINGVLISPIKWSYSASTDLLTYNSPRLSKGKKTVKVEATDAAKNVGAKSWYFTIR